MKSERHLYEGEAYLRLYPKLAEWMRVCSSCRARGHDPEMPPSADSLRRYVNPLEVDLLGRCAVCRG